MAKRGLDWLHDSSINKKTYWLPPITLISIPFNKNRYQIAKWKSLVQLLRPLTFPKRILGQRLFISQVIFESSPVLISFPFKKLNIQWAHPYWGPSFTHLNIGNWKYSYLVSQHSFCPVFIHTANYSQNIILCEHAVIMSPSSNLTSHLIFLHNTGVIREGRTWTRTAEKALCESNMLLWGLKSVQAVLFLFCQSSTNCPHLSDLTLSLVPVFLSC